MQAHDQDMAAREAALVVVVGALVVVVVGAALVVVVGAALVVVGGGGAALVEVHKTVPGQSGGIRCWCAPLPLFPLPPGLHISTPIGEDSARRVRRSLQTLRPLAACMQAAGSSSLLLLLLLLGNA